MTSWLFGVSRSIHPILPYVLATQRFNTAAWAPFSTVQGGRPRPNRSDSSIELGSRQGSAVRRPLESLPLDMPLDMPLERPLHPPWPRRKIPSPTTSSLIAIRQDDDSSPCHSWLSRRSPACPSPRN